VSRLNYARIVYRLLTSPRGWRVDRLQADLEIAPRTWTKYRKVLEEEFEPFFDRGGGSRLQVVQEGDSRWLRLVDPDFRASAPQLLARLAAYRLAGLVVGSLGESLGQAVADAFTALGRGRKSKEETRLLSRLNRDLDRLLYFRPHAAKDYRAKGEVIDALLRSLVKHKQIVITYEASNGAYAQHELEPLTLTLYQGGLYVLARYPGKKRVYNFVVDRIGLVEISKSGFSYPSANEYHPERILADSFGIFFRAKKPGKKHKVELVFADKKWLQVYLLERKWHPTQKFRQLSDGRLRFSFEVSNLVEVAQWVRGFGDDVEILKPKGLRDA
jgi:predicted DNA-binding transcriptional regulator YafY